MIDSPALYPELIVEDLDRSSHFYVEIIGFTIEFSRPEGRFHYMFFGGAHLMILEDNDNQHSRTGPMEYPRGQGVNFPIATTDVFHIANRLEANSYPLRISIRDQWHRENQIEHGEKQLWVMDPGGYLLRFFQSLGTRKLKT